jgi:hypothetical protein
MRYFSFIDWIVAINREREEREKERERQSEERKRRERERLLGFLRIFCDVAACSKPREREKERSEQR